jgi:hypothetical protein
VTEPIERQTREPNMTEFAAVGGMLYDLARKRGLGTQAPAEWFHQDKKYIS